MKITAFLFATLAFASSAALAEPVTLLVDFEDDATAEDVRDSEREFGIDLEPTSIMYSATKLTSVLVDRTDVESLIDGLGGDWDVEGVEVSQTYTTMGGADFKVPNDPEFAGKQKWQWEMIELSRAWKYATGKGVVVAVLDTVVSYGDTAGFPRVGDLKDTEILRGYSFINDNKHPNDGHMHGTHCASTIAQSTNNALSGSGIAFEASILPVQVLSASGSGSTEAISEGIRWATDNGAHVISLSLGGGGYSEVMNSAVQHAVKRNVLVIAAAGNTPSESVHYPSAYDNVLAISAVAPGGTIGTPDAGNAKIAKLASYASYGGAGGKKGIFLGAPGGDKKLYGEAGGIWQSTIVEGDPTKWALISANGSSMATPAVSGVAALVISELMQKNGGKYKASEVKKILADSATKRDDKLHFGAGVLNAGAAAEMAAKKSYAAAYGVGVGGTLLGLLVLITRKKR